MNSCDYCRETDLSLYEIFSPSGDLIYHICFKCQLSTFLCTKCLHLRDQAEEHVNGYCVYETKYYKELNDKITDLQNRLTQLETNNI